MFKNLESIIKGNGNEFITKNIMQFIKSITSPNEFLRLYRFLIDTLRYELKDPLAVKDYKPLYKVVEKNKEKIIKGELKDSHQNLVLLVVGHLENPKMYYKYTDFFRSNGIAHIYWVPLHHFQDIPTNSDYFIEMAENLLEKTEKEKIDIIAHSRGGLVTSYAAMVRPDELRKFNKIINVGTPFHGTVVANIAYWLTKNSIRNTGINFLNNKGYSINPIKEMLYCSKETENLSNYISKVKDVEFYSIFSLGYDEAVIPGECSIIDSKNCVNINIDDYLNLKRVGHIGLTRNKKILQLELDILKGNFNREEYLKECPTITFEEFRKVHQNIYK